MSAEIELLDASDSISTRSPASAGYACAGASPTTTLRVLHVINGEHYAGAERVQRFAGPAQVGAFEVGAIEMR
jgi:hypothetical protein